MRTQNPAPVATPAFLAFKARRDELKIARQSKAAPRRDRAWKEFKKAKQFAWEHGLVLKRHSAEHYTIRRHQRWVLSLYPGCQKICPSNRNRREPWIVYNKDGDGWTLFSVVQAAINAGE